MQHITQTILAILSMCLGGFCTLMLVVFLLAGGANSTETQIRQLKWMIVSALVIQALALAASIWLLIEHRGWTSCIVGLSPLIFAVVLVFVLVKLEW